MEEQLQEVTNVKADSNRLIVYALMGVGGGTLIAYVALPFFGFEASKELVQLLSTIVGILGGVLKGST